MRLRFRTLFWAATGLLVAALIIWAAWPRPILVDLAVVERTDLTVSVRDEGRTRVREIYTVSAPVAGRLLRIEQEAGDPVAAGEAIASILPSDPAFLDARSQSEARAALASTEAARSFAIAEVQRAEAQLEFARTENDRIASLFERGTVSQGALDRTRLELRTAQAALATARANVRMRSAEIEAATARLIEPGEDGQIDGVVTMRSPIDGRVLRVIQESETVTLPGAPVMEVGDPGDLEVVVELLSSDAVQVEVGAEARIEAWGGEALRAQVQRVEPFGFLKISALGVEEQRVNVVLDFVDPPERWTSLGHGFRVEAAITVWRGEDVIIAPTAALFRTENGWAVFALRQGRARLIELQIGRSNGQHAQILSGLEAGDEVILYPTDRIRDGVAIRSR
ncbi:MAG: efflux RND transporter periplasmic adaptor subunit [Pseudomonadota bacterium]